MKMADAEDSYASHVCWRNFKSFQEDCNAGLIDRRIYAALGGDKLNKLYMCMVKIVSFESSK